MSIIMSREFKHDLTAMERLTAVVLDVPTLFHIQRLTQQYESALHEALEALGADPTTRAHYEIIRWRYGFDDGQWTSLEKIGKERGPVTKERIRQVEESALNRLRRAIGAHRQHLSHVRAREAAAVGS